MAIKFRKRIGLPGPFFANVSRRGVSFTAKLGPWSWNSRSRRQRLDLPGPFSWQSNRRDDDGPRRHVGRWVALLLVAALGFGIWWAVPRIDAAVRHGVATVEDHAVPGQRQATAPAVRRCRIVGGRADRACTPGAMNPAVTQRTIARTICVRGWTATVRPSASYTGRLKGRQKGSYGEADVPNRGLEEDHLVPLELGGSPTDPTNLWPQPRAGARSAGVKDREENSLHRAVCAGRLSLAQARTRMVADWTHA